MFTDHQYKHSFFVAGLFLLYNNYFEHLRNLNNIFNCINKQFKTVKLITINYFCLPVFEFICNLLNSLDNPLLSSKVIKEQIIINLVIFIKKLSEIKNYLY